MYEIGTRITEIILQTAELDSETYKNVNLSELRLSSIQYIKIIVAIEKEYFMEFDENCLIEDYFSSFEELVNYVGKNRGDI